MKKDSIARNNQLADYENLAQLIGPGWRPQKNGQINSAGYSIS